MIFDLPKSRSLAPCNILRCVRNLVTGQLADCQLADWSTRGLDNSRTSQLADWTTRGLADAAKKGKLSTQSRRRHPRVVQSASCLVRELTSPRDVQSATRPVRELAIRELAYPRVVQ